MTGARETAHLRIVGADAENLLLVDAAGQGQRLPISAVHEALAQAARAGTSRLSPREIQDRLRSGASVEQVAQAAGVSVERVRRWEGPVLAERAQAVDRALLARYSRPPDGSVSGPLGRLVEARLATLGLVGIWNAWRDADGWVVEVVHDRGQARWHWDGATVVGMDPHAESLGHREPPRSVDSGRGPRSRAALPSWESILADAPPPNAFPT